MNSSSIIRKASEIPTLTEINERELLSNLALNVPDGGTIVEIGCLYGGVTAILALSSPGASVTTIDNFSWHPDGFPKTSKGLAERNLMDLGINNVTVIDSDSRKIGRNWDTPIDLLWIDGGHSFEYVYSDLYLFGPLAQVIALHDYDNPAWGSIRDAVAVFMSKFPNWYIDTVVGMVVVLRRR